MACGRASINGVSFPQLVSCFFSVDQTVFPSNYILHSFSLRFIHSFSSSIGVLGCHINTSRVAYWPMQPGCNNLCKKVTAKGRSIHLLHIDTSGGAYDISYDAWNYLNVGVGAQQEPTMGGGISAEWEDAPMSACADLIKTPGGKLPLMAANSINTYVSCPNDSWLHKNAALYNIANSACTL